jgi:hypothetical protein
MFKEELSPLSELELSLSVLDELSVSDEVGVSLWVELVLHPTSERVKTNAKINATTFFIMPHSFLFR